MKSKIWFAGILILGLGAVTQASAQVTVDNGSVSATFHAAYDTINATTDFTSVSISGTFGLTLNLSPIPVTFAGGISSSWADAANWGGYKLALADAVQIGLSVASDGSDGGALPACRATVEGLYDTLYVNGGPTEKLVTAPVAKVEWNSTSNSGFNASQELDASLNVKFDVTIPSGKTAVMDQNPVVLEHLTNAGNLTGNGNGLTINQNLQNTGVLQSFGANLQGDFTNSAGASATITGGFSIQGGFQNSGTLVIGSSGSVSRTAATTNNGVLTLNGGQLSLPGGLIDQGTVDGYGTLKININEFGKFTADVAGQTLAISTDGAYFNPVVNNSGTLGATNGGTLSLIDATINGGNITANNGSVSMQFSTINGSTLSGGINDIFTVNGIFNKVVNNAQVLSYYGLNITGGSLINGGTITIGSGVSSGYAQLYFTDDTTLSGAGDITLNGGSILMSGSHAVTLSQAVHGWGSIQSNLNSSKSIAADSKGNTLTIGGNAPFTINNTGTLSAINGGNLSIGCIVNGGAITASNGSVSMYGATINGCTLSGGVNDLFTVFGEFINVTANAQILSYQGISVDGGSLTNGGTITIGSGVSSPYAQLYFLSSTNLGGAGSIALNGGIITGSSSNTVTLSQPIHGWGSIQTNLKSSNNITADTPGNTLTIGGGGSSPIINNAGTLGVTNGCTLAINSATVNGGIIKANGGSVSIYGATINGSTLSGGANDLFTVFGDFNQVITTAQIFSYQGISVDGGSLVNGGTITIGSGASSPYAQLYFTADTTLSGTGSVLLNGGSISGGRTVTQAKGHTLSGVGTISTPLINAGTIAPGITFGTLTFNNGLSLVNTSHLLFAIGGSPSTGSYDHITVSGTVSLNGALDLKLVSGFVPKLGDSFQIMTCGTVTGGFTALNGLLINEDLAFSVSVTATSVTLTVVNTDFARWKAAEFGANASNPNIAGAQADPDGDGISNLLEYAFGLNPNIASQSGLPFMGSVQVGSSTYLSLSYRQLIATTQLSYVVGVSDDLQTWDWSESQIQQVGTPVPTGDGLTEQVTVRLNTPISTAGRKFMRVSVAESF